LSGASADEKQFHRSGAASEIIIRRAPRKPAACNRETPDTPESRVRRIRCGPQLTEDNVASW
jgi:hypothetical protein